MTVTSSSSSDILSTVETAQLGGKKSNGHKASCGCPICINMKHAKHGGSSCSLKTGGKKRKGNGHKSNCGCPICKNMKKKRGGDSTEDTFIDLEKGPDVESEALDSEYNALDAAEKGEAGTNVVGGTRRRKGRKTRKTKRSSKKTHRKGSVKKRTHKRR